MIVEETGKVTQKGQVTIPIEIRTLLKIEEGDRLRITIEGDEAKLEVIKKKKLSEVFGILGKPPKNAGVPIEEAIKATREQRGMEIGIEIANQKDGD